ncbi:helix-turn-helix transcriptional regulator [uncultured Clostridium sp.]|jgi:DNA-binding XRE family transcriptional regulator|uniref:helix-turn-helix domain-containing protein n=1 Tax=uncultured Clostridium sp. TaxID=59620 RepID=UPI00272C0CA7|nr:helix-turn-helix transcriptional regulator [uncultured Clostridium sp.]
MPEKKKKYPPTGSLSFGKNLEKILDELQIKKTDLAKGIGVTKGTITNITKGYCYPRIGTIVDICKYLNIDVEVLTGVDPKLEIIAESARAYAVLKDCLVSVGALKNDEEIKENHIELLKKVITDNKKLYQQPDKALESEKLIIVPLEDLPNNN